MSDDELWMIREDLDGLPRFAPPPHMVLRGSQPGDAAIWAALQAPFYAAGAITPDTFATWFGTDEDAHAARIMYLLDGDGRAIGTAAAWSYDGFRAPAWGRVHWLAVDARHQGRGLGKVLLSAVCHRLVELGHTSAYLTTSRARPNAVALYRAFGFVEL